MCSEPLSSFASGRLKVIHARSDCHLACCLVITTLALVAVLKFNSSAPGAGERFGDKKCKICFRARLPQSSGFILTFAYYSFLVLQLAVSIQQTMFWLIPPFMLQILLTNFKSKCQSRKINLFKQCI